VSVSKERTVSLWMNTDVASDASPLRRNEIIEVMVVGSGIGGQSTAYELVQRGKEVGVLDRGPIGKGRSSRTTAHLVAISDDSFDSFIGGPPRAPACSGTHLKCVGISRVTDRILRLTEQRSTLTPWQPLRPLHLQRQRSTQKHARAFETICEGHAA
jgi:glycine/D-amino acid oxidase-like deaminating enzyme